MGAWTHGLAHIVRIQALTEAVCTPHRERASVNAPLGIKRAHGALVHGRDRGGRDLMIPWVCKGRTSIT